MDASGFKVRKVWEQIQYIVLGGLIGVGLGYLGWDGISVSPLLLALGTVLFLFYYVNNRRKRRSININSEALLTIEAEPTVSWQVVDVYSEEEIAVIREGSGQAQFFVPVNRYYLDASLLLAVVPEKLRSKFEHSRFCAYKPRMMFFYSVLSENESDAFVCQLQVEDRCERETSDDGIAGFCLFFMNPVHASRHWIWPDWFEIFNRQAKQD
jgi:hypothetical protein